MGCAIGALTSNTVIASVKSIINSPLDVRFIRLCTSPAISLTNLHLTNMGSESLYNLTLPTTSGAQVSKNLRALSYSSSSSIHIFTSLIARSLIARIGNWGSSYTFTGALKFFNCLDISVHRLFNASTSAVISSLFLPSAAVLTTYPTLA